MPTRTLTRHTTGEGKQAQRTGYFARRTTLGWFVAVAAMMAVTVAFLEQQTAHMNGLPFHGVVTPVADPGTGGMAARAVAVLRDVVWTGVETGERLWKHGTDAEDGDWTRPFHGFVARHAPSRHTRLPNRQWGHTAPQLRDTLRGWGDPGRTDYRALLAGEAVYALVYLHLLGILYTAAFPRLTLHWLVGLLATAHCTETLLLAALTYRPAWIATAPYLVPLVDAASYVKWSTLASNALVATLALPTFLLRWVTRIGKDGRQRVLHHHHHSKHL